MRPRAVRPRAVSRCPYDRSLRVHRRCGHSPWNGAPLSRFDLVVRGGTVVTPAGAGACDVGDRGRPRRRRRARAREATPRRRSTRRGSTSSPASSTRTCTATIRAAADWEGLAHAHPCARGGRGDDVRRHAAEREPADGRRRLVRPQARRRARGGGRRLRPLGRPRARAGRPPRRARRPRRRRLQGVHVPDRRRRLRDGGRRDAARGDGAGRAARAARRRARGGPGADGAARGARRSPRDASSLRDYLHSRPVVAELRGDRPGARAGGGDGVLAARRPRLERRAACGSSPRREREGVDVTCETCPHYLALDEEDAVAIGMVAKCSPPLREREEVEALWRSVLHGDVDLDRLGPLAEPARAEAGRRRLRRLGRHRRRADAAPRAAHRGATARARAAGDRPPHVRGARAALPPRRERARSSPAPTPTSPSSTSSVEARARRGRAPLPASSEPVPRAGLCGAASCARSYAARLSGSMALWSPYPRGRLVRPAAGASTEARS